MQTLVHSASARMASESNSLPTFFFPMIKAHIMAIETMEMMIPQKVVSGLCPDQML